MKWHATYSTYVFKERSNLGLPQLGSRFLTDRRSQHLREAVSLAPSRERSFLPPTNTCSQERLRIWILFQEFIAHWAASQILVLRFPHFLHAPNPKPQDLEKSTNSCDPYAGKISRGSKELPPYINAVCPLQDPRETHLHTCRTNHRPTAPAGTGGLSAREIDHKSGHPTDTGHRE